MIDVGLNYTIDLARVINKSNTYTTTQKEKEDKLEANYIVDTFAKDNGLESEALKDAKIVKVETENQTIKKINEPKVKRRRVVKYIVLPYINKLEIIKQITLEIKTKGNREIFRDIKIFENEDLLKLGYLNEDETINYNNPLVKKIVPKNK